MNKIRPNRKKPEYCSYDCNYREGGSRGNVTCVKFKITTAGTRPYECLRHTKGIIPAFKCIICDAYNSATSQYNYGYCTLYNKKISGSLPCLDPIQEHDVLHLPKDLYEL